jgi:hypothetical protein
MIPAAIGISGFLFLSIRVLFEYSFCLHREVIWKSIKDRPNT